MTDAITAAPSDVVHSGRTIGKPDGEPEFRPEFGCKVGTFTTRRAELDEVGFQKIPCLMFHVPRHLRGPYRPDELANFDPDYEYRVGLGGQRLCEGKTKAVALGAVKAGDGLCKRKAANRQPYCEAHGGRLHPLDKTDANLHHKDPATMSRLELLQAGYIDVEDLTDDELRNGVGVKGKHVRLPKELYAKITQRHFARAQELLTEGLLPAVQALNHIAQGSAYEPADRIKAATYIIERVMGKQPDIVVTAQAKEPWEQLVAGINHMSREESRRVRSERVPEDDSEEILDAEEVGPEDVWKSERYADEEPTGTDDLVERSASPEPSVDVSAAKQKRYKMRAAGRSDVEDGPIVLGSKDAARAANVTLGAPGADQVS